MLKSMKKPDPKPTPEQLKMAKRLKDVQSKQRNSPEGKAFTAEMLSKNAEASKAIKDRAAERKYISDLNIEGMGEGVLQSQEDKFGEEEFGPDYKDLNLKPSTYREKSGGKEEVKKRYTVKTNDTDPRYREEVERVNPYQDVLRVYRTSKYKGDSQVQPEYGIDIKGNRYNPRTGEEATVYEESIKQRAEKNRANLKARIKAIADRGEADAKRMIAEEAKKAQQKAGGNK